MAPSRSLGGHAAAPRRLPRLRAATALFCVALWAALSAPVPAAAQGGNPISKALGKQAPAGKQEAAPESAPLAVEEQIARAEDRLDEVKRQQEKLERTSELEQRAIGATTEEIEEQRRLLVDLFRSYTTLITALRNSQELASRRADLEEEITGWQGFEEKPPYAVDFVDEIQAEIISRELNLEAIAAEKARDEAQRDLWAGRLAKAEPEVRRLTESLEGARDPAQKARLQWQLDLARLRSRAASVGQGAAEAALKDLEARADLRRAEVSFLRRKLAVVVQHAEFSQSELDRHLEEISRSRERSQRQIADALAEQEVAERRAAEARTALQRAQEALEGKPATPDDAVRLKALEGRLDARQAEYETATLNLEALKTLMNGFDAEERIWKDRFSLRKTRDPRALNDALAQIDRGEKQLALWEKFFITRMQLALSQIVSTKQELTNWTPEDGDRLATEAELRAYDERLESLRLGMAEVEVVKTLVDVWRFELTERRARVPLKERVTSLVRSAGEGLRNLWKFELFTLEDSIVVDGQEMKGERPVTVGKILAALLILGLGIWFSRLLARAVHRIATSRFKAEENVAALLDKALSTVVIVAVVLFAISFVKIPLTAFAFAGGALAIGAGFGAQNLINNFISGIILLLERPIKLGDIVDVEGIRGRVVNIGARCSSVKRFDGIDMLIPNSSFLEKNVTNWTRSDPFLRFTVTVGVAYGSPTHRVQEILEALVNEDPKVLKYPESRVVFEDFGDSALIFTVYFWMAIQAEADYRILAGEMRHKIADRFRSEGITIAFPQRDVHLDSLSPVQVEIVDGASGRAPGKGGGGAGGEGGGSAV